MTSELPKTADAVVVGGGTVGAWCAYFLRPAGLENVVLVEKGVLGQGGTSRAAGVVAGAARDEPRCRSGARSGRDACRGAPRPVVARVLPGAAGRARHRLRVRPAG